MRNACLGKSAKAGVLLAGAFPNCATKLIRYAEKAATLDRIAVSTHGVGMIANGGVLYVVGILTTAEIPAGRLQVLWNGFKRTHV
jgi:hypothetical protein